MSAGEIGTAVMLPDEDVSVPALVRLAIEKGVDVEVLERLVALQERVTERNAEMAMAEALAAFQAACPAIPRVATAEVKKNGVKQYEYQFAPLDEVARVIRPHLTAAGLSYVHDATVAGDQVEVTCTLQHIMGAKRKATFRGPIDTSGGKNPIQQVASARSYGRRYSLIDVLGLTTEKDDDAAGTRRTRESEPITEEQLAELLKLRDAVGADTKKFCDFLGVETLRDIPADRFEEAKAALEQKRRRA